VSGWKAIDVLGPHGGLTFDDRLRPVARPDHSRSDHTRLVLFEGELLGIRDLMRQMRVR
jgi:hypothetical protein